MVSFNFSLSLNSVDFEKGNVNNFITDYTCYRASSECLLLNVGTKREQYISQVITCWFLFWFIVCLICMQPQKPFILSSLPHGSRKLQGVKINKIFCITFSNSWDSPMEYVKNAVSKPCHWMEKTKYIERESSMGN